MDHLERLWIEIVQDSESNLSELVYNDTVGAGDSHRLWNSSTDETLRRVVSAINSKLNDPKSREYGMVSLSRFMEQIDPGRLVAIHEGLTSSLHLSLKCLDVDTTHQFLAIILPHCRKVPELNQAATTAVVPKVLSSFCDSFRNHSPSVSELKLVRICLQKYHGPCGNQRANLEKRLLTLLEESQDGGKLGLICQLLPLISSAGGGGTNGMKHSEDWKGMLVKVLASMQDCIISLYGDACPMLTSESSFGTDVPRFALSDSKERNVFQRITLLKNRLVKLAKLLGNYLSDAFPAPKPVPVRSVLSIVRNMLILDPINILKSYATPPREYVYLSVVLPAIRQGAYGILQKLTFSVGSNILTEVSNVEELTLQELKWMAERPEAFSKLKSGVYEFIISYLESTRNQANPKTILSWSQQLIADIQIKRMSFELNQNSGTSKSPKRKSFKASRKVDFLSTVLSSSGGEEILPSNPMIATLALKILTLLIPSLDAGTHKLVSVTIGRLATAVVEAETYPSPYDNVDCRKSLFSLILSLVQNPHPLSPISLGFFANLLRKAELDELCSAHGRRMRSFVERITHPICPTLIFPTVLPPQDDHEEPGDNEQELLVPDQQTEMMDSFCQTEEEALDTGVTMNQSLTWEESTPKQLELEASVRHAVESTLHKLFNNKSFSGSFRALAVEEQEESETEFTSALCSPEIGPNGVPPALSTSNVPGSSKRKFEQLSSLESTPVTTRTMFNGNGDSSTPKRAKGDDYPGQEHDDGQGHLSFEVMIADFVN